MTYGKSDGRFLLYGEKFEDRNLAFCHIIATLMSQLQQINYHLYAHYVDSKISPIYHQTSIEPKHGAF